MLSLQSLHATPLPHGFVERTRLLSLVVQPHYAPAIVIIAPTSTIPSPLPFGIPRVRVVCWLDLHFPVALLPPGSHPVAQNTR